MNVMEKIASEFYHTPLTPGGGPDALKRYREDINRRDEIFKADLLAEHGLTDHPKAQAIYRLAWEHGHAGGLSEVVNYFIEFAELVKA